MSIRFKANKPTKEFIEYFWQTWQKKAEMTLTEQLRKGELDRNEVYYYETPFQTVDTASGFWLCNNCGKNDKITVLAPVPSYEQWQAKLEENKRLKHDVGNLGYKIKNQRHEIDNRLKEIEKLKSLLKECRYEINPSYIEVIGGTKTFKNLVDKINQVLGEE